MRARIRSKTKPPIIDDKVIYEGGIDERRIYQHVVYASKHNGMSMDVEDITCFYLSYGLTVGHRQKAGSLCGAAACLLRATSRGVSSKIVEL